MNSEWRCDLIINKIIFQIAGILLFNFKIISCKNGRFEIFSEEFQPQRLDGSQKKKRDLNFLSNLGFIRTKKEEAGRGSATNVTKFLLPCNLLYLD